MVKYYLKLNISKQFINKLDDLSIKERFNYLVNNKYKFKSQRKNYNNFIFIIFNISIILYLGLNRNYDTFRK